MLEKHFGKEENQTSSFSGTEGGPSPHAMARGAVPSGSRESSPESWNNIVLSSLGDRRATLSIWEVPAGCTATGIRPTSWRRKTSFIRTPKRRQQGTKQMQEAMET